MPAIATYARMGHRACAGHARHVRRLMLPPPHDASHSHRSLRLGAASLSAPTRPPRWVDWVDDPNPPRLRPGCGRPAGGGGQIEDEVTPALPRRGPGPDARPRRCRAWDTETDAGRLAIADYPWGGACYRGAFQASSPMITWCIPTELPVLCALVPIHAQSACVYVPSSPPSPPCPAASTPPQRARPRSEHAPAFFPKCIADARMPPTPGMRRACAGHHACL
jgi:hypothetical protein